MPPPDQAPAFVTTSGPEPTFSIVIAAYQAEAVIGAAVESALGQTYPALEVIVCDDGSTDGTVAELGQFGDRIRVVTQPNGGEAAAKNRAAREARGDWVVVLDADDRFHPGRLRALADLAAARPDLDVLTSDAWLEVGGHPVRRVYEKGNLFEVNDQRREILRRNFVFGLAAVRRDRLVEVGGFDENIRVTTDWDLWIRLVLSGSRIGLVNEPLAVYCMLETSLSANRVDVLRGRLDTLRKTYATAELSDGEARIVADNIEAQQRQLDLAEVRAALVDRRPDARRRAFRLAASRDHSLASRAKGALAALSPALARRTILRPSAQARLSQASRLGGAAASAPRATSGG